MNGQFDKDQLWRSVLGELSVSMSTVNFMTFINPCQIASVAGIDNERVLIEIACPSGIHQQTVDERFYGQIKRSLENQTGMKCEVALIVRPGIEKKTKTEEKNEDKYSLFEENKFEEEDKDTLRKCGLNPKFSFDNFVVGGANNLAYAAAKGVVDSPGVKHNPFFIWGGVGVGKTHLMHAVGRALWEKGLKNICAITSEQFTNELISTIRSKNVGDFKKKYRGTDALLIDDIQFFAGKEGSQEEFFHTFNELCMKEKQIILTSDRKPQDIEQVEQRLISRFLGGLTVDIGMPDYEMRLAILKQKSQEMEIEVDEEALDLLANSMATNSRELEGMLIRLANLASLKRERLSAVMIESEIGVKAKKQEKKLRPQEVISMIAKMYDFKNKEILGSSRKANLVMARHVTIYILRKEVGLTLERVAELMGGRDHTTIMHAVDKIEREFTINQSVREQVMKVKQCLYR